MLFAPGTAAAGDDGVFHVLQTVGYYGFGSLVPLVLASKGYTVSSRSCIPRLTFVGYPVGSARRSCSSNASSASS